MPNACVISNGNLQFKDIKSLITRKDFIVAVDGGYKWLYENNLRCDLLVGDFDSLSEKLKKEAIKKRTEIIKFNKEKDETDTELALCEVIKREYKNIILLGAMGNRMDHTLANISLLEKYSLDGVYITILDNNNEITCLKKGKKTIGKSDQFRYISFISLTDFSTLSLSGFKYNIKKKTIRRGETLCVSNEVVQFESEVTVTNGRLLMIRSCDGKK